MANRINLHAVCGHLVTRLSTLLSPAWPTGLGLQTVQYGDLMYLPAESMAALTAKLPAILVKPVAWTTIRGAGIQSFTTTINFRLMFVFKFADGTEVVNLKAQYLELLGEKLLDEYNLPTLSIAGVTVIATRLKEGNMQPPEDDIFAVPGTNITVGSVDFDVEVEASV